MVLLWAIDRAGDVELTVFHGRLGRPFQPSDSDDGNRDPDPDFPSKAVSAEFFLCPLWSARSR